MKTIKRFFKSLKNNIKWLLLIPKNVSRLQEGFYNISNMIPNQQRKVAYENTAQLITSLMNEHHIKDYFFNFGSALSLLRDGYLEPKQLDIDISVLESSAPQFLEILDQQPQFLALRTGTEMIRSTSSKIKQFNILDDYDSDCYDKERERIIHLEYFDTLNLVFIDISILYPYDNKYCYIWYYPTRYGYSYYMNIEEVQEGLIDLELPSAVYTPEILQLAQDNNFQLKKVKYRILKNSKQFLNRALPNWDIHRIEHHALYYKDYKKLIEDRKKVDNYYLAYKVNPTIMYYFNNNLESFYQMSTDIKMFEI